MPNSGTKTKLVFFGTGPVAAASLELLHEWAEIEAVITKPKPAHHKGSFPVAEVASHFGLPLIEMSDKKDLTQKISAQQFSSPIAVLIDFGIIVEQAVIDYFPHGIINSHFSLLPEWRGADPITFSILSGQERTGVSLMLLVEAMDEGPIVALGVEELDTTYTTPLLTKKLIQLSNALLKTELPRYIENGSSVEQSSLPELITDFPYPATPTYSRKLTKEDGILDFSKSAVQLEREVRAYAEWPKSRTNIAGKDVVITMSHVAENTLENVDKKTIFVANKQLCMQTADGILVVDQLKPAGKSEMSAAAFLAGYSKEL